MFFKFANCERENKFHAKGGLWELASVAFLIVPDSQERAWCSPEAVDVFSIKTLVDDVLLHSGISKKLRKCAL